MMVPFVTPFNQCTKKNIMTYVILQSTAKIVCIAGMLSILACLLAGPLFNFVKAIMFSLNESHRYLVFTFLEFAMVNNLI